MASIQLQLKKLQKQINIPYKIEFVNHVVEVKDFKEKIIYVHILI